MSPVTGRVSDGHADAEGRRRETSADLRGFAEPHDLQYASSAVRYRLIACDVLTREIGVCLEKCPHTVDVEFSKKGAHNDPKQLRALLQSRIDAVERSEIVYDAVLLGFGICGNSTMELEARSVPVVIPRAHDCCTLFLGSRLDFMKHFKDNPSRPFHSPGYSEREGVDRSPISAVLPAGYTWESLVEKYGEEDAREVVETLDGTLHADPVEAYIDVPETRDPAILAKCEADAARRKKHLEVIPGNLRLIRMLLDGNWTPEEFQVVEPHQRLSGVYDWDRIVTAKRA